MSNHLEVFVSTIPHRAQEYDTVGNWTTGPGVDATLEITVSEMPDERYEFLVALHELVEGYLCRSRGISQESVTAFDLAFERARGTSIEETDYAEPGDDPRSPYHSEHYFATRIERIVAAELGVSWHDYEMAIESLTQPSTHQE